MHRMGLINFWLYDYEEFFFADGKLMLRGLNASGKSITTQSFIPFILDGDRRPSRLDPFGSTDRRMEYYFLNDTENDDVTGYLFLEFKKEDTDEYRTIGIGQRVQRGRNGMGFWGFVVLDGRRVGYGISLVRDAGGLNIPLSMKELENQLGNNNFITTSSGEYKEAVNKYLFGFQRIDLYEQYVNLLIKVRAPKLSKEFKPSKVYDILNDSLQTLSDDDLRPMVETMEKLDEMEMRLSNLRLMEKELSAIKNEYERYNRFMLSKKAGIYVERHKKTEEEKNKTYEIRKENGQLGSDIEDLRRENETLLEEIKKAEEKIALFGESDLMKLSKEIEELEEEINTVKDQIKIIESRIEERKKKAEDKRSKKKSEETDRKSVV